MNSTIQEHQMTIAANELKTKGVSIIETMLNKLDEVLISIRGKIK